MKFCEKVPDGMVKISLSSKDLRGNTGLSYLESRGYYYTASPQEADFFISISGQLLPSFILQRTIVIITEPSSRYKKRYAERYRKVFGGFLGISRASVTSEEEFYLGTQNFSLIQELKEQPEYMLAMVHQRYKRECRNLEGDIEREKAVEFFDKKLGENFHTYGRVWRQTLPWDNVGWKGTIKGAFMGDEKILKIRDHRFLLCFENTRDDGYITEKLFSALFAGSIPIYFGSSNITEYIPSNCYIYFDGQDYDALFKRMTEMTESEFQEIRNNGREFLYSSKGEQFTSIAFAKKLEAHFTNIQKSPITNSSVSPSELWRKLRLILWRYT